MPNNGEIGTFKKIKVLTGTKKLKLVPIKTCPKIKDPCRHSAFVNNYLIVAFESLSNLVTINIID